MRLIDADALEVDWYDDYETVDGDEYSYAYVSKYQIDNAPTITAQPKTGKWIKVHGYYTPGGDPVWACSECGKGIHVYGIEHGSYGSDVSDGQWKACPNCGCRMTEE